MINLNKRIVLTKKESQKAIKGILSRPIPDK